jgi:hypothetical protein
LYLFADNTTAVQWTGGALYFGQNVTDSANVFTRIGWGDIGSQLTDGGDSIIAAANNAKLDGSSNTIYIGPQVFHSTDPFQVMKLGDASSAGYVEMYALIATPVAP